MKTHSLFQVLTRVLEIAPGATLLFTVLLASQFTLAAYGQSCAECATAEALPPGPVSTSEWSFAKEVNEVNLLFVATHNGRFIDDLSQNDITVLDDRKPPAAILAFRTERELPLRVGLVIDTSSSVTSRFRFEQRGASAFLFETLRRKEDQAFVMGFSNDQKLAQDFTSNPEALSQGVQRLTIGGGTALYDAVAAACEKLLATPERDMLARVLVVLSDGQNNAGKTGLNTVIGIAQQAQVAIYTVSTNYHYTLDFAEEDWDAKNGNENLRRLAEQTGGRLLTPPDAKSVGKAFAKIAEELRSRYAIAYRPADFVADGHYRKISIAARRPGEKLQIRTRKGYYAKLVSVSNLIAQK
ncbi:MAG TPA: VWA domain-containing protein [Terriglobales bacterium]|nr:VWA domain-containing protein [Terriglobales bacterium]